MEEKILNLVLKKRWFDMIESGFKKEEYRDIKPFWTKRLKVKGSDKFKSFTHVVFRNGYQKEAPTIKVKITDICVGHSNPDWCGGIKDNFYKICLGDIIERNNIS